MKKTLIIFCLFAFCIAFINTQSAVNAGDGVGVDPCINYDGELNDCGVCTSNGNNDICPTTSCTGNDIYNQVMSGKDSSCFVICTAPEGLGQSNGAAVICGGSVNEYMNPQGSSYDAAHGFAGGSFDCTCSGALTPEAPVVESQLQSIVAQPYVWQGPYPYKLMAQSHHLNAAGGDFDPDWAVSESTFWTLNHVSYQYLKSNALREIDWRSAGDKPVNNWFYKFSLDLSTNRGKVAQSWAPTENGYKSFDATNWEPVSKSEVHTAGTPPTWFPATGELVPTGFMVAVPANEVWVWMVDGFGFCVSGMTQLPGQDIDSSNNMQSCDLGRPAAADWGYTTFVRADHWQEAPMMVKPEIKYTSSTKQVTLQYTVYSFQQAGGRNGANCFKNMDSGSHGDGGIFDGLTCDFKELSHWLAPVNCLGLGYSKSGSGGQDNPGSQGSHSPCYTTAPDFLLDQIPQEGNLKWEDPPKPAGITVTRSCSACSTINPGTSDQYVSLGSSGINIGVNFTLYKYASQNDANGGAGIESGCMFIKSVMFDCSECVMSECPGGTFRPDGVSSCDCVECDAATWEPTCQDPTPYWDEGTCSCTDCIPEHHQQTSGCDSTHCYQDSGNPCEPNKCAIYPVNQANCDKYGRQNCGAFNSQCCPCNTCDSNNAALQQELCPSSTGDNPTSSWNVLCECHRCAYTEENRPTGWSADDPRLCDGNEICSTPPRCKPAELCGEDEFDWDCGNAYYDGGCGCEPCAGNPLYWGTDGAYHETTHRDSEGNCRPGYTLVKDHDCAPCEPCDTCPPGTKPAGFNQSPPQSEQLDIFIYVD